MTPAEFKASRESMGLSTKWLADRWQVSEYSVQRWERNKTLPVTLMHDFQGIEVDFRQRIEAARGAAGEETALIVPRTGREAPLDHPAQWFRMIAQRVHEETGAMILYYGDEHESAEETESWSDDAESY
jgi:hypothetical protein